MGAICSSSKNPSDEAATPQHHHHNDSTRGGAGTTTSNDNNNTKTGSPSASFRSKSKRQASVSIVGADDDGDINDLDNSKRSLNIDGDHGDASNIHPHNSSGGMPPLSPGTTAVASSNSNPLSRTSSPPAGGFRSGKDSVLSNNSNGTGKDQSIGETPASELPPGSVIRRDNSISMPTRRRGSSVSLVLTPDQHLNSNHCRSPPAPVLSREGSGDVEVMKNKMDDLDLGGSSIAAAVLESQTQQKRQGSFSGNNSHSINPLSQHSAQEHAAHNHIPETTARHTSSPDSHVKLMAKLSDIPLASESGAGSGKDRGETSMNCFSKEGSPSSGLSRNHSGVLPNASIRGEQSFAKDEPDAAEQLGASGNNTLLLPTHRRKRGSSVALKMSPEDHLKSPRIDSPSKMKPFDEVAKDMAPLSLGKKLLEEDNDEDEDDNQTKENDQ